MEFLWKKSGLLGDNLTTFCGRIGEHKWNKIKYIITYVIDALKFLGGSYNV